MARSGPPQHIMASPAADRRGAVQSKPSRSVDCGISHLATLARGRPRLLAYRFRSEIVTLG